MYSGEEIYRLNCLPSWGKCSTFTSKEIKKSMGTERCTYIGPLITMPDRKVPVTTDIKICDSCGDEITSPFCLTCGGKRINSQVVNLLNVRADTLMCKENPEWEEIFWEMDQDYLVAQTDKVILLPNNRQGLYEAVGGFNTLTPDVLEEAVAAFNSKYQTQIDFLRTVYGNDLEVTFSVVEYWA